ncbi:unnamed protein product [Oncorhynchus mykiss]|uniref:ABC-2 type transporter transmembrane domain-containing protein n=1 Tax=Oncorhynchus mykiss TaxID=8022 RepID=A0A060XPI3_ONCMY|nr:unnamed protein product [Oncorhynchus mykiss]
MIQRQVSKEVVDGGSVHVWLDLTNRQIALMLQKKIKDAFEGFIQYKMSSRSYLLSLPVKFEEPIYGSMNSDFTTFVTPGAVLSITFYLAVGLTALSFVIERKEGLMERCWVSGVSSMETVLAYLISQLIIISVQIILLLILMLLVFKIPNEGNLVLVIALIVLQGITGTSFGLVISSAIDDEQNATQAALGIFYPNLIVSGTSHILSSTPTSSSVVRPTYCLLPQPHRQWYNLACGVHPLSTTLHQSGPAPDLRF